MSVVLFACAGISAGTGHWLFAAFAGAFGLAMAVAGEAK